MNHNGSQANAAYIVFAHRDMRLEDAERALSSLADLGLVGGARHAKTGRDWKRCRRLTYAYQLLWVNRLKGS